MSKAKEEESVTALLDFLKPRIEQAKRGVFSQKSPEEIRREARKRAGLTD